MSMLQELVESKVSAMMTQLVYDTQTAPTAMKRSLTARDGFANSLLWATGFGGINSREVCCQDFWLPATADQPSRPALPSIYPEFTLSIGSTVDLVPRRLKTSLSPNTAKVQLTVAEAQLQDPLWWLHLHLHLSQAAGSLVSNVLVRPADKAGTFYQEKFLESPSLLHRLKGLLQQL